MAPCPVLKIEENLVPLKEARAGPQRSNVGVLDLSSPADIDRMRALACFSANSKD